MQTRLGAEGEMEGRRRRDRKTGEGGMQVGKQQQIHVGKHTLDENESDLKNEKKHIKNFLKFNSLKKKKDNF